ncbi:MAG TPA: F0F1 ATP synthase subunit B [Acidobacteriota bacterium]|nr:F0F1 ATP synthase subunit B [Acidobacteriota bacterium]
MSIEWQQVLTHAVGFLITVWILKRFAWRPLMDLIEERREKIAGEFRKIEDEKAGAAKLTAEYEGKLRDIDRERRQKLVEAVTEGKKLAAEIKSAAQEEVRQINAKAKADLEREIAKARVQLRDEIVGMTITATEKMLHEELDQAKQRELVGRFIDDLEKA